MAEKNIFRRVEKKYILTENVYERFREKLERFTHEDSYGWQPIYNVYFDTVHDELIRHSLEKPVFKEKMRMRSYGTVSNDGKVFLELKKKFDDVVYKRRIVLPYGQAKGYLREPDMPLDGYFAVQRGAPGDPQIKKELDYFLRYRKVYPKIFIKYDRIALISDTDANLRITFDKNLAYRLTNLTLNKDFPNETFLNERFYLMEIKTTSAIPLWLCGILTGLKINPVSFSKYGEIYSKLLMQKLGEKDTLCLKVLMQTA